MPPPDCSCKVINAKTRYERDNASWIIGRVVRDFESWRDPRIDQALQKMLDRKWEEKKQHAKNECPGSELNMPRPRYGGLCVSIYEAGEAMPGSQGRDLAYYSGFAVAALQLVIAAIPCGIWGDWGVILITTAGIILSFAMGSLPQWVKEKWACRTIQSKKTFVLVRGNGSGHAIVIRCNGRGLDLEDLAAGPVNVEVHTSTSTRVAVVTFAFLWLGLLITASGIQRNTWFLLAVGGFGILQNLFVAGGVRDPAAFGMPLIYEDVIAETKAMETLFKVEERYPGVGRSLLNTFFPGHLRPEETKRWEMIEQAQAARPAPTTQDSEGSTTESESQRAEGAQIQNS